MIALIIVSASVAVLLTVFVFAGLVCLGLLSPLLYAAATVLPLAAGLLRRLIRLIGGSR